MFLIPPSWYRVKKIGRKGRGVFAMHDIPANSVVGDYAGTIVHARDEDEQRDGLYTMYGGERFDILASPKNEGVHLINHSCANNCDIYPYRGHMLYVATRRIFAGEEISVHYMLGKADKSEKNMPCTLHACHCGSRICTGSMHDNEHDLDAWEKLMKKESGVWYKKLPGKYGAKFPPLKTYPALIKLDGQKIYHYHVFGSEKKPPVINKASALPPLAELRTQIRETGRQITFPKLHLRVYGIQHDMLIAERI